MLPSDPYAGYFIDEEFRNIARLSKKQVNARFRSFIRARLSLRFSDIYRSIDTNKIVDLAYLAEKIIRHEEPLDQDIDFRSEVDAIHQQLSFTEEQSKLVYERINFYAADAISCVNGCSVAILEDRFKPGDLLNFVKEPIRKRKNT